MSTQENDQIFQRQGPLASLKSVIREQFLAFDTDSNHLLYSKDGQSYYGFYNSAEVDAKFASPRNIDASQVVSGVLDIARIPVLPSQLPIVSSGDFTALTAAQQAQIIQGTVVTTTDGARNVYSGTGDKTLAASYVLLADVSPDWSVIANKPTTISTWTNDSGYITLNSTLTGFTTGANSAISASDSILGSMGKLQGQINNKQPLSTYLSGINQGLSTSNAPHFAGATLTNTLACTDILASGILTLNSTGTINLIISSTYGGVSIANSYAGTSYNSVSFAAIDNSGATTPSKPVRVIANLFVGDLAGNATSATNATQLGGIAASNYLTSANASTSYIHTYGVAGSNTTTGNYSSWTPIARIAITSTYSNHEIKISHDFYGEQASTNIDIKVSTNKASGSDAATITCSGQSNSSSIYYLVSGDIVYLWLCRSAGNALGLYSATITHSTAIANITLVNDGTYVSTQPSGSIAVPGLYQSMTTATFNTSLSATSATFSGNLSIAGNSTFTGTIIAQSTFACLAGAASPTISIAPWNLNPSTYSFLGVSGGNGSTAATTTGIVTAAGNLSLMSSGSVYIDAGGTTALTATSTQVSTTLDLVSTTWMHSPKYGVAPGNSETNNGSPWYGMGMSNVTGYGGSGNYVQLAGYFGIYLTTAVGSIVYNSGGLSVPVGITGTSAAFGTTLNVTGATTLSTLSTSSTITAGGAITLSATSGGMVLQGLVGYTGYGCIYGDTIATKSISNWGVIVRRDGTEAGVNSTSWVYLNINNTPVISCYASSISLNQPVTASSTIKSLADIWTTLSKSATYPILATDPATLIATSVGTYTLPSTDTAGKLRTIIHAGGQGDTITAAWTGRVGAQTYVLARGTGVMFQFDGSYWCSLSL